MNFVDESYAEGWQDAAQLIKDVKVKNKKLRKENRLLKAEIKRLKEAK